MQSATRTRQSVVFMGSLYAGRRRDWLIACFVRKKQGMELEAVAKEIPVE